MNNHTVMKVECAWCGVPMGEKDGQGVEGVSYSICLKCEGKEWAKLGGRPPARWNIVGRLVDHLKRKRKAERISLEATAQEAELAELQDTISGKPNLHALVMLVGQRYKHFLLPEDLAGLEAAVAGQPEFKCKWN